MCGIYVSEFYDEEIIKLISNRGKDHFSCINISNIFLCSSVLSIRSSISQPVITNKYVLLYNGEIYNEDESDTLFIKKSLDEILKNETDNDLAYISDPEDVLQKLHQKCNLSQNEFGLAVMFKNVVLFFKDDMGKKSMGLKRDIFTISSVKYDYEIDNTLLYSFDITSRSLNKFVKNTVLIRYLLEYRNIVEKYLEDGSIASKKILDEFGTIKDKYIGSTKSKFIEGTNCNQIEGTKDKFIEITKINQIEGTNCNQVKSRQIEGFDDLLRISCKRRLVSDNIVVFFSGGVDSILVALFLHLVSDTNQQIYLINCGFENSQDRANGIHAYAELKQAFPFRTWHFIKVNLDLEEIRNVKDDIYKLIYPKTTKMDFNIGLVLHFTSLEARKYSKVCYLGSGADELFCGYSKYKNEGFRDRMLFDTLTLSYHNLARDDRIVSNNNLEIRLPLLDTDIVNFSFNIEDNLLNNGIENKILLRMVLRKYGLGNISGFLKKAMQYGTGLNKVEVNIKKLIKIFYNLKL